MCAPHHACRPVGCCAMARGGTGGRRRPAGLPVSVERHPLITLNSDSETTMIRTARNRRTWEALRPGGSVEGAAGRASRSFMLKCQLVICVQRYGVLQGASGLEISNVASTVRRPRFDSVVGQKIPLTSEREYTKMEVNLRAL